MAGSETNARPIPLVTGARTADFDERAVSGGTFVTKILANSRRWSGSTAADGTAAKFAVTADFDSGARFDQ
jgi:hypothetical protein